VKYHIRIDDGKGGVAPPPDVLELTVIPRLLACLLASLIAASFASAPELQKNALSAHEFSHSQFANMPCCGV
jgi:hypothetical protein